MYPKLLHLAATGLLGTAILSCGVTVVAANAEHKPLRALIVDGQNNHDFWPKTSMMQAW